MGNIKENRIKKFGSGTYEINSRWTPIDPPQRSLNERDPRSFVASPGPVDANIRYISKFNRDSGDYNKEARIYNREKGNYSRDASKYRSEPRNYNDNLENYTIRDPLTYSSRDNLKYSGSYSKNIERVNTRLSSERDNIRSTPTNASNANKKFHCHYTVIDPRRGSQFYNAKKALVNRVTTKPNPDYICKNKKPKFQHTSERKSEIKVQEKSLSKQSVQPAASIKIISNKNLLTSDNDTKRGQTSVHELGSEVRKDNIESKSTQNAINIQDEKDITSSSKDDEIRNISCKGVKEPKAYVSTLQILEKNAPYSTENTQKIHKPEDSEASSCSNVPDSTNMSELSQSTENENSSVADDSKSHANDNLNFFLAILKDPSRLKEVLTMLPAHLRESLQALAQTDHTVSENKLLQLNKEPAIVSSEAVTPSKYLDKRNNADIVESENESENFADLEKGGDINTEKCDKNLKQPTKKTLPKSETGGNKSAQQASGGVSKRLRVSLINLEKQKEVLKVVNCPEESPTEEVERSLKLENSLRGVSFQLKTEPEPKNLSSFEESDVICLNSDDETNPEVPPEVPPTQNVISLIDGDDTQATDNVLVPDKDLYACDKCKDTFNSDTYLRAHLIKCYIGGESYKCPHCSLFFASYSPLTKHMEESHKQRKLYRCWACGYEDEKSKKVVAHVTKSHRAVEVMMAPDEEASTAHLKVLKVIGKGVKILTRGMKFGPDDVDRLPTKPIFDEPIHCSCCEFNSKVRTNMISHLQQHRNESPTSSAAPVNTVPHLESKEMHFDRMTNLSSSSHTNSVERPVRPVLTASELSRYPRFIQRERFACGAAGCAYISIDEVTLRCHWDALHANTPAAAALSRSQVKAELNAQNTSRSILHPGTSSESQDNEGALQIELGNIKQEDTATAGSSQLTADDASLFFYGQPGEPDGVKFLCPLCRIYSSVQTNLFSDHLYEELGYRSWCCEICTFRGFTESQLIHHLSAEHSGWQKCRKKFNHIQDLNIEAWISLVIRTQQNLMIKNSRELSKSKRWLELQEKFGPSCQAKNGLFACPRCTMQSEDRALIEDHLMRELEIFTWYCSVCTRMYHRLHTANKHASSHVNEPCRISRVPVEWKKEWIKFAVEYQVDIMNKAKKAAEPEVYFEGSPDNELLVVRREDNSTTVPDAPASCTLGADGNFY